jgi:hypothetical protein
LAKNGVARFEDNSSQTVSFAIDGKLHFKRFQLLKVDDKINRIILSGTFEVKFIKNGLPQTLSDGRFDMGITNRDFYSYAN